MEQATWMKSLIIGFFLIGMIIFAMWALPQYSVWTRELRGKAALREAEWSKKVQIEEAGANLEAEKLNAQSEIERAKGMAEAMRIEGGQLTTQYIQYLWVKRNAGSNASIIYIPTEANLPILEAARLK